MIEDEVVEVGEQPLQRRQCSHFWQQACSQSQTARWQQSQWRWRAGHTTEAKTAKMGLGENLVHQCRVLRQVGDWREIERAKAVTALDDRCNQRQLLVLGIRMISSIIGQPTIAKDVNVTQRCGNLADPGGQAGHAEKKKSYEL